MNDLFQATMSMLRATAVSPRQISDDTGLGYRWLMRLKGGEYSDPGVNKIQKLHDYLAQSKKSNEAA